MTGIISPANFYIFGIPAKIFSILIPIIGIGIFAFIMKKRIEPLMLSAKDNRFNNLSERLSKVFSLWLLQIKQPRYLFAGILHIVIFFGFLILAARSKTLVMIGVIDGFTLPGFSGKFGDFYTILKDFAATIVLIACIIAAIRRGVFKPKRYAVPKKYGKDHTKEAVFVLGIISLLMISESIFDASQILGGTEAHTPTPLTLAFFFTIALKSASLATLQTINIVSYFIHDITFFFFLCFLPLGKHFHVITSIFNVFTARLKKGVIKPVQYGISDEELDNLDSFGIKKIEDFTWKHILDFYSCADCGRCSDRCPANTVQRPLSPRFLTIKARDLIFKNYPILGEKQESTNLIGNIYTEDEIWSCTTCGACEEECPISIEYIDKIVDLRRSMIDEGMVPQSLQKPLKALEKRGNPYGKTAKKRIDWTKDIDIKTISKKETAENLFFVDSISSYDDRMIEITKSCANLLSHINLDFGILGKEEKDAGNEVRRFGEEMLFQDLKEHNTKTILNSKAQNIITADPHTLNTLNNDYSEIPKTQHITQIILKAIKEKKIQFKPIENLVFTYHDPCYLGRHNELYDEPRAVLDAIPNLQRVEMKKSRDRSFCCGGGGLMLFYEPEEEIRMGVLRVQMAKEVGANVIVVACPFCMANLEDALKVAGLEKEIQLMDIAEIAWQQTKKN